MRVQVATAVAAARLAARKLAARRVVINVVFHSGACGLKVDLYLVEVYCNNYSNLCNVKLNAYLTFLCTSIRVAYKGDYHEKNPLRITHIACNNSCC